MQEKMFEKELNFKVIKKKKKKKVASIQQKCF